MRIKFGIKKIKSNEEGLNWRRKGNEKKDKKEIK